MIQLKSRKFSGEETSPLHVFTQPNQAQSVRQILEQYSQGFSTSHQNIETDEFNTSHYSEDELLNMDLFDPQDRGDLVSWLRAHEIQSMRKSLIDKVKEFLAAKKEPEPQPESQPEPQPEPQPEQA